MTSIIQNITNQTGTFVSTYDILTLCRIFIYKNTLCRIEFMSKFQDN